MSVRRVLLSGGVPGLAGRHSAWAASTSSLVACGLSKLVVSLASSRGRRKEIKEVWGRWEYKVSKVQLAAALWPALLRKIQLCKTMEDAPVPPIVQVISDAYHLAQQWRYLSFILTEVPGPHRFCAWRSVISR